MGKLSTPLPFGLTLPTPAYLFGALLFGILGLAAFRYGRQNERPRAKWMGVALMLYPYLVAQTWLLYLIGVLLCLAIVSERG
ncbi:conserved hypothetical protein [Rubrivivax sp. A210]|uniref:hypothetical protein n=1 Tax=Rubrivivax sp. A210 TaxID=2772301 RepID=UPI00191B8B4C|nr:hypothetical protein [Rubrivivax sp. A210]CAD5372889.1 conserved hypothetical protein [Rubrivivax sp. A210]